MNYDFQMNLWSKVFSDVIEDKNAKGFSLTLTNPLASPQRSREKILEILFEYYGFSALNMMSSAQAISYRKNTPLQLIVESGNSASYVVPVLHNNVDHGFTEGHSPGCKKTRCWRKALD